MGSRSPPFDGSWQAYNTTPAPQNETDDGLTPLTRFMEQSGLLVNTPQQATPSREETWQSSMSVGTSQRSPNGSSASPPTFVDYIQARERNNAAQGSSSSMERKRRRADTSPDRRSPLHYNHPSSSSIEGVMYGGQQTQRPTNASSSSQRNNMTSSPQRTNVIDLTSSSPPPQRPQEFRYSPTMTVRPQDLLLNNGNTNNNASQSNPLQLVETLPDWQPDHEATNCPVCNSPFTFFHRKHHCRKCGRVVCNNCSPHRITIPKQYVVASPGSDEGDPSSDFLSVRVCNPCVPDPWAPDSGNNRPRTSISPANAGQQHMWNNGGTRDGLQPPTTPQQMPQSIRARAQTYHQPTFHASQGMARGPSNAHANHNAPRVSSSYTATHGSSAPTRTARTGMRPPPTRPTREVREEDECPVCGRELPPGEEVRTAHVSQCITTRFGSTSTPPLVTPNPLHPDNVNPREWEAINEMEAMGLTGTYRMRGANDPFEPVYRPTLDRAATGFMPHGHPLPGGGVNVTPSPRPAIGLALADWLVPPRPGERLR